MEVTRSFKAYTASDIRSKTSLESVEFYRTHLGFTLDTNSSPRSPASRSATRRFYSAVHKRRDLVRCRTVSSRSPADGIVSCFG